MLEKLDKLTAAALTLNMEERAQLAGRLLLSLDEPLESEVEALWLEEAQRRLKAFRNGTSPSKPSDEVFQRALEDIS